ncbi:MAG: hypothetical protein JNL63_13425 [Bacteroidia bacterium]|nr:hypothetical protein [Bacteroidia bacterium]
MKTKLPLALIVKAIWTSLLTGIISIQAFAQWTVYNTGNSNIPSNSVKAVAIDANGIKWIGTEGLGPTTLTGLSKYTGGSSFTSWGPGNSSMISGTVNTITFDSLNNVWMGTINGAAKLSGTTITPIDLSGNDYIQEIAIDKKGYLWASAHSGLFRIKRSNNTWTMYDATNTPAMGGSKLNAVTVDNSNNIWTGGWDSGVRKFDGNATWTKFDPGNSVIPGDWTNYAGKDSSGNIWVTSQGSFANGNVSFVGKYNGSAWTIYRTVFGTNPGPVPSAQIYSMAVDKKNGVIWFGSQDKGLIKYNGSTWQVYNMSNTPGMPSNVINGVALDTDGSLWIATAAGLAHWSCTIPALNTSSDPSICQGTSSTLTVSGAGSYFWSPASGLNTTNGVSVIASPSTTTTYTVTGSTDPGCSSTKAITVTVKTPPAANAGTDTGFCPGSNVSLTASGGTGYSWSPVTGLSSPSVANPVANPVSTTTYTVIVTAANGCTGSDQVVVEVNPPSMRPIANAGSDVSFCPGTGVTLAASGGTSYSWSPATGLNSTTVSNPFANPSVTTTYTVTVKGANGCSNTDQLIVSLKPLPSADAGFDGTICSGDIMPLQASGGVTYFWSPSTGLSSTTISNPDANPTNDITYTVTVTGTNGCTANSTVSVTVYQAPPIPVITKSGNVLTANSTMLIYEWYKDGNPIAGAYNKTYTMTGNGSYYVVVTNADGCSSTSTPFLMTGVNEFLSQNNLNIVNSYFDAGTGEISLTLYSHEKDQYIIELLNIAGQRMIKYALTGRSGEFTEYIPAADLGKGIYMLTIVSGKTGFAGYKKLVVE